MSDENEVAKENLKREIHKKVNHALVCRGKYLSALSEGNLTGAKIFAEGCIKDWSSISRLTNSLENYND